MAVTIRSLHKGLAELEDQERRYTGIASALPPRMFRSADLGRLQNASGWIMDDQGRMSPWHIEGVAEEQGQMIFYGPAVEGKPLDPDRLSPEQTILLGRIFLLIREKNLDIRGFYSRGWMLTSEKEVLIFPPELMDFIRKAQTEPVKQEAWYPFNHPDRKGAEGLSFTLAALTYKTLSGTRPYAGRSDEELSEEMRTQPPIPLELRVPGLRAPLVQALEGNFSLRDEASRWSCWQKALDDWEEEGPCGPVSPEEEAGRKKKLAELTARRENRMGLRVFWRKRRTLVAAILLGTAALGAFISAPVRKALEPPLTMGMGPEEVIAAYYGGFETLDQEIMEDAIQKKAGKNDLNEVMNFFVTSRVRQGYEGTSGLLSVAQWTAEGRPLPALGTVVYGLTEPDVRPLGGQRYEVRYEKWLPASPDESAPPGDPAPLYPVGYAVRDTLVLEQQKKGNWLIISLEREAEEL